MSLSPGRRVRLLRTTLVVGLLGVPVLAGCAPAGAVDVTEGASPLQARPAAAASQAAWLVSRTAAESISAGLHAAASWTGQATYLLTAKGVDAAATVRVARTATAVRTDVSRGAATASLLRDTKGWVACDSTPAGTQCVSGGPAAGDPPAAFDPGLDAVLTKVVPTLASRSQLRPDGALTAVPDARLPAATCVATVKGPLSTLAESLSGRYCVSGDGVVRQVEYGSGTLTLVAFTSAVDAAAFAPRVTPAPLG